MAVLNAWQRIDRVISGRPWGDGFTGSATVSSDPNTRATITGTAASTSGTAGSTSFANGDVVLLHQTRGTGAGQWEINRVASGGGTTSLVFQVAHKYTYGTGAQIIKVPRYTTATVTAHSVTAWNGTTGGVEVICGEKSVTVSGALNLKSLGFRAGGSRDGASQPASSATVGENYGGTQPSQRASLNGAGGAGGTTSSSSAGGGGAGYGTDGTDGAVSDYGYKGVAFGSEDLTKIHIGPGGGGYCYGGQEPANGTEGGGICIIIAKNFTVSGSIDVGASDTAVKSVTGGCGAGGSFLGVCQTATLGTGLVTAIGGTNRGTSAKGGNGGVGRIAIHHSGTVTGTTNPTYDGTTDATLMESSSGASFLYNFI